MVKLGDGPKVIDWGEWNIWLKAFNGSNWSLVRLENVLHVTDLSVNSVPVISALDKNLKMASDQRKTMTKWQLQNVTTDCSRCALTKIQRKTWPRLFWH